MESASECEILIIDQAVDVDLLKKKRLQLGLYEDAKIEALPQP